MAAEVISIQNGGGSNENGNENVRARERLREQRYSGKQNRRKHVFEKCIENFYNFHMDSMGICNNRLIAFKREIKGV